MDTNAETDGERIDALSTPPNGIEALRKQFSADILASIPTAIEMIEARNQSGDLPSRAAGRYTEETYPELISKYSSVPLAPSTDQAHLISEIAADLLGGIPLWRSPSLQYNVGAAPNRVSSALYGIALDLNVFNINDGLTGNAIIAEHAVTKILADLADLQTSPCGLFTFGGTGTNLYAMRLGLSEAFPDSRKTGVPKGVRIAITEDAHFSHLNALNWLGVGTESALVLPANPDRTTNIREAERVLRATLSKGQVIPAIVLNGGTTYDNAIDDIEAFAALRDALVSEYALAYVPHIHVDSVIGWAWLTFKGYDFKLNPLSIEARTLSLIQAQYARIRNVRLADSWGVDFHKGVGACPIPSSVIMINRGERASLLAYKDVPGAHQLSSEFSSFSPVDFTLETSRPAGAPLAALGAFHALGIDGYRAHLSNLVQQNQLLRLLLSTSGRQDVSILNDRSSGYVTMLRLYPPKIAGLKSVESLSGVQSAEYSKVVNEYMKSFFAFDLETRMRTGAGVEYSYSSKYIDSPAGTKVSALKFYPTSPHAGAVHTRKAVEALLAQKDLFDKNSAI